MNIVETKRLLIRELVPEDEVALPSILSNPNVMRFSSQGVMSPEQIRNYLTASYQRYQSDGFAQWAVVFKDSGDLIGVAGLVRSEVEGRELVHISYRLKGDSQGYGFGIEAVNGILHYAQDSLCFTELYALIDPENTSSMKLAKKAGFVEESTCHFKGSDLLIYKVNLKIGSHRASQSQQQSYLITIKHLLIALA